MRRSVCVWAMCVAVAACVRGQEQQEVMTLEQIEALFAVAADDPMLYYQKCKALFAAGKHQEAVDFAHVALAKFIEAGNPLEWMLLGSFKTDTHKIDVICNMGALERVDRSRVRGVMTRPYSFRFWTLDDPPRILKVLDWEILYMGGRPSTDAVGEMQGDTHINYGSLGTDANFKTVKAKMLSVIENSEPPVAITKGAKTQYNPAPEKGF
ncbi:MAG: hypothetical protein FWG50_01750 [Kiritimatiellaeota bacterium]|nr:hypothetical protein [Kiritimatiellota bacterium]